MATLKLTGFWSTFERYMSLISASVNLIVFVMTIQNDGIFTGNSAPKYLHMACTANFAPILWIRFCLRF